MREKATAPGAKCSTTPVHHPLGLGQFPGKEQVPNDHHPAFNRPSCTQRAGLAEHLQEGRLGRLR